METYFIIKEKSDGSYFLATGMGVTSNKSEAYRYTREEVRRNRYFSKTREVLILVNK